MFDRILLPTDGSEGAKIVIDSLLDVATDTDASIYVLHVVDVTPYVGTSVPEDVLEALTEEGHSLVDAAAERAAARDVTCVTEVVRGDPASTITAFAREQSVDLVAMPTHGRTGLERLLLGSVTEKVLRTSDVPVLTLRPDRKLHRYPYETVLLPTDGSEPAEAAARKAIAVTAATGAALHVVSVVDAPRARSDADVVYDALEATGELALDSIRELAVDADLDSVEASLLTGRPHRAILEYAEAVGADLVVMGTRGRRGMERHLLGSVTERVVRTSDRPVLAVPAEPVEGDQSD